MNAVVQQEQDRGKALLSTLLFHAGLIAILFFYRFSAAPPITEAPAILLEWGGGGDNAAAGLPDEGQGNDPAPQGQQMDDPSSTQPVEDPAPSTPAASKPTPSQPSASTPSNTPTSNDPDVAALKKQKEDAKRQKDEQDRVKRQQQDEQQRVVDAQRKAQKEAADRARVEQDARDKKKGQFGSTFGKPGSTGTGQGNTGKPGNQGIPGGNSDNPFGKSNGTGGGSGGGDGTGTGGSIGGGLGGRKVVRRGHVNDNSQKKGTVVVEVCVDNSGNVISADYTQRGSTTSDSELRSKAIAAAKQFEFAPSASGKECGTITFNFRLK
ncbi:MAG: TonB family protein [Saprospiraceae bacterium]